MRNMPIAIASFALCSLAGMAPALAASGNAQVGSLDCDVSAGLGVIIGTQQEVTCTFSPSDGAASEQYKGKITEFGLDIGEIKKAKMAWLVFDLAAREKGALAGSYTGISADAALGLGLGADVLVGGGHGTISLQPVAVEAEEGINIAAGISEMTLRLAD